MKQCCSETPLDLNWVNIGGTLEPPCIAQIDCNKFKHDKTTVESIEICTLHIFTVQNDDCVLRKDKYTIVIQVSNIFLV